LKKVEPLLPEKETFLKISRTPDFQAGPIPKIHKSLLFKE
jgi:hypothetical protein